MFPQKRITVALAGNPNSGKTTVFNSLTGLHQQVGNYPGVTVEKKEGRFTYKGYQVSVVDLPGTYSLTAHSLDELITRRFLIEEKPDIVINVIDASNLERNLYLTTQLMQLGLPLILVFNMQDLALEQGLSIDKARLEELLGSPIILSVASKRKGIQEILEAVVDFVEGRISKSAITVGYRKEINDEIAKVEDILRGDEALALRYPSRWLAIKLLEQDSEVNKTVAASPVYKDIGDQLEKSVSHLKKLFGDSPEALLAEGRYGFISGACSEAMRRTYETRHTVSDRIDSLLINHFFGLPIFLGLIWMVFRFIFFFSQPFMRGIEIGQEWLAQTVGGLFPPESAAQSLIVEGVIDGVGSVLVFVPVIFLLYFSMAVLEYSGYMARAAFIMDRFMHKIGLHGRSFIPMLLGFGCNVPAILATRTIEDPKDRFVTILVNPLMSCGARLPVYALFIGAFFPKEIAGNVLFSLYLLGVVMAVILAKVFRKYFFRGEAAAFVMELPPYRLPAIKGVLWHTGERVAVYLKKAGTIIFAGCVLVWFLSSFPWNPKYSRDYASLLAQSAGDEARVLELKGEMAAEKLEKSYAGRLGQALTPVFRPLGFGDWKITVALLGGVVGKEIVVSTLGTLYSVGESAGGSVLL
ncbi:MAG: ferrous iron transport protein B, partial [Candidatus Omnitrophota bacterium]